MHLKMQAIMSFVRSDTYEKEISKRDFEIEHLKELLKRKHELEKRDLEIKRLKKLLGDLDLGITCVTIVGADANPVFQALAAQPDGIGAPPKWNFTKYLLDRDGTPVARWPSNVEPSTPSITNVVEALLEQRA